MTVIGLNSIPQEAFRVNQESVKNYQHSKKVGNYLIGKSLGEGSFARVKEALHTVTGEKVAVKIISKEKTKTDPYIRKNLRREGRILQQIRHNHIVQLFEVLETENYYYLVLELCQGGDLMNYIVKRTKLSEFETRKFIRQLVQAVDFLHKLGVLHRDLKIENLLLDENNDLKIIDFGLSNMVKTAQDKNGEFIAELCKTQCGSPAYAAPEVLAHQTYGVQVDIWSIGVNMYAMLTGNLPFTVKPFNIKALCSKMMAGEMNPLPRQLSKECCDLLHRFLNPNPEQRITLKEAMSHDWLNNQFPNLTASPFPGNLRPEEILSDVTNYMSDEFGYKINECVRILLANTPHNVTGTYYLLLKKAMRFCQKKKIWFKISNGNIMITSSAPIVDQTTDELDVQSKFEENDLNSSLRLKALKMKAKKQEANKIKPISKMNGQVQQKLNVDSNLEAKLVGKSDETLYLTEEHVAKAAKDLHNTNATVQIDLAKREHTTLNLGLFTTKELTIIPNTLSNAPVANTPTVFAKQHRINSFDEALVEMNELSEKEKPASWHSNISKTTSISRSKSPTKQSDCSSPSGSLQALPQTKNFLFKTRPSEYRVHSEHGQVTLQNLPEVFVRHSRALDNITNNGGNRILDMLPKGVLSVAMPRMKTQLIDCRIISRNGQRQLHINKNNRIHLSASKQRPGLLRSLEEKSDSNDTSAEVKIEDSNVEIASSLQQQNGFQVPVRKPQNNVMQWRQPAVSRNHLVDNTTKNGGVEVIRYNVDAKTGRRQLISARLSDDTTALTGSSTNQNKGGITRNKTFMPLYISK